MQFCAAPLMKVIVAGAIFTIPALYILALPPSYFQMFMASALGGFLGILFLIPFRNAFKSYRYQNS